MELWVCKTVRIIVYILASWYSRTEKVLKVEDMANAADQAYEKIGQLILKGHFTPGDRLSEEELSRLSGVSRTPVRDALKRLEAEYFVVIRPNQGAEVAIWNARDIEDLFQMRALLEGLAAARAAERHTSENIDILEGCVEKIGHALDQNKTSATDVFLKENKKFHLALVDAAASPRLSASIANLIAPAVVARTARTFSKTDLHRSNDHHRELVEAIKEGDGELAEVIMQTHIRIAARSYRLE